MNKFRGRTETHVWFSIVKMINELCHTINVLVITLMSYSYSYPLIIVNTTYNIACNIIFW